MQTDDLFSHLDLTVPPDRDPTGFHDAFESGLAGSPASIDSWHTTCYFRALADTDRFATINGRFDTGVALSLTVYRDPDQARRQYETDVPSLERHEQKSPEPSGHDPTTVEVRIVGTVDGSWDDARSLKIERAWPEEETFASALEVRYLLLQHNLLATATGSAWSPPDETTEVVEVVREVMDGLVGEAVEQLTLGTGYWPSEEG